MKNVELFGGAMKLFVFLFASVAYCQSNPVVTVAASYGVQASDNGKLIILLNGAGATAVLPNISSSAWFADIQCAPLNSTSSCTIAAMALVNGSATMTLTAGSVARVVAANSTYVVPNVTVDTTGNAATVSSISSHASTELSDTTGIVRGAAAIAATQYLIPVASGVAGSLGVSVLKINTGILYPTTDSVTGVQINKADGTTNIITVDTSNKRFGVGTAAPTESSSTWGGNISVADPATVGTEVLTNGALTGGTSWTQTTDCALAADAATCTFSAGTASTVQQASGTLASLALADKWYAFTYTISAKTGSPTASITTAFASALTALNMTAGTNTTYFRTAAAPGNFVITTTLTTGQAFTIDTLSLKPIQGGNAYVAGLLRSGRFLFADIPSCTASLIGTLIYCRDCKNVTDDTTGIFDSAMASGGNGTNVLCENETTPAWRVH